MANKIGPSFPEELRQAGVVDFRFAWSLIDGTVDYHPDVPADERAKVEAVLAAHDGPLSVARHEALEGNRGEVKRLIGEKFLQPPGEDLIHAEINAVARAVQIVLRVMRGTALPEERADLDMLDGLYDEVSAIRQAKDAAKAALLNAKTVAEVEAVKPAWPGK